MPTEFHDDLRPVLLTNIFSHARGTMAGLRTEMEIDAWFTHTEVRSDEKGEGEKWFVVVTNEEDTPRALEGCMRAMEVQFGPVGIEAGTQCLEQCGFLILSGTGPYQRAPPGPLVVDLMMKAGFDIPADTSVGMFAMFDFGEGSALSTDGFGDDEE